MGDMLVSQIECLREKLHKVIESGNIENILEVSKELDELILLYMRDNDIHNKKLA